MLSPRRISSSRFKLLVALVSVAFLSCSTASAADAKSHEVPALEPSRPIERTISSGESHIYSLASSAESSWRIVLDQRGIDVVVVVIDHEGTRLAELNDPLGRFDREVFLLGSLARRLEIRPLEGGVASGPYSVTAELVKTQGPAEEGPRNRAERGMSEAASHRYGGSDAEMQRAAELYEAAGANFAEATNPHGMGRALLSAANFRRRLGLASRAFEHYEASLNIWRELGEKGFMADSLMGLGQCARRLGQSDAARSYFDEAVVLWEELGRGPEKATTLASLGLLTHIQGDFQAALSLYRQALDEQRRAGQRLEVANLLLNIGGVQHQLGDAAAALDNDHQSLEIFRELGERDGELDALNNLAGLHRQMGEPEEALRLYDEVLKLATDQDDRVAEARALNNRGFTYRSLGEPDRAAADLRRSLALRREAEDQRGELISLINLSDVEYDRGYLATSQHHVEEALDLSRRRRSRQEIGLLGRLGLLQARRGDTEAKARFEEAQSLVKGRTTPMDEALLLYRQSEALLFLGDPDGAREAAQRSLALWAGLGYGDGEVMALTALGRTAIAQARPDEARRYLAEAVERLESVRTELANPNLRASYLAARREAHALLVDVLMNLHAHHPNAGYARDALTLSERGRARRLLDLLAEAEVDLERSAAPELASRRRDLLRRLSLLVRRRQLVESGRYRVSPGEELDSKITDVRAELDVVEGEIRRRNPRRTALTSAAALDADAIQRLVEPGTTLLYFTLGQRRSHLWAVNESETTSFELAPPRDIETAARRLHEALATLGPNGRDAQETAAAALADMVLRPAIGQLKGERLVIIADGALHYVPFAVLPLGGDGTDLRIVDRFETVHLPSASILGIRRHAAGSSTARESTVAILADPVFDRSDPRLTGLPAQGISSPEPPLRALRLRGAAVEGFGRLPGSRREAEMIAQWLPAERRLVALGFAASRDVLKTGAAKYSIVHFATHGFIDTEQPELSSLVLTQFNPSGRRRTDGFLRLHDIYTLELDAELVVLSGCRTGLGRELRGEGFIGLTGGFFYAGARRVMASLWPVADQATALLMHHFYRGLLVDKLPPAAALRRAQLEITADRRFRDPYYWGAFVLQGDWR